MKRALFLFTFILSLSVLFMTGCKKEINNNDDPPSNPTKFTELKVDPSFKFDNFLTLNVDISAPNTSAGGMNILQVYQDDPTNGRMVASGITYGSQHLIASVRLPLAVKEVYLRHTGPDGSFETVKVPISGTSLVYAFGTTKSVENGDNLCGSGTAVTTNQTTLSITSGQTKYVPYGTTITINKLDLRTGGTFNICGTVTVKELASTNNNGGIINNHGTLTFTYKNIDLKGTINNNGTLNVTDGLEFKTNTGGKLINNCSMFVTGSIVTTGSGAITNNGYIKVIEDEGDGSSSNDGGSFKTAGSGILTLGPQSLIDVHIFDLLTVCNGPSSASYAQIKTIYGKVTGGGSITGYVDLCAGSSFSHKNSSYGPNVTKCINNVPVPNCATPTPPEITSALTAAGTAGEAFSYVITATGTELITFNAANLPAGLTFDAVTHTISGTPATAGTYNINLFADNSVGTDNEILVLTVGAANTPPVITSPLTAECTAGSPFDYTITATGDNTLTCPMSFNASPLPEGLTITGSLISGTPVSNGTFDITLTATNCKGTDTQHLILTVEVAGVAPNITSSLTANGNVGVPFAGYTLTATGTEPFTNMNATNLPAGLVYDATTHMITGTPTEQGITEVSLVVTNAYGTDVKTLVITIGPGAGTPPVIQPPLTVTGVINQPFTPYTVVATGTGPINYTVGTLPAGLSFNATDNTISGVPTVSGTFYVELTATNSLGTDTENLEIIISAGGGGSYYTYYPNSSDYGTFVFEDLWPYYGDYDFNDLVVNFQYKITSNAQNQITDIQATFIFKAAGASMNNGFGFVLNTDPENIESVNGCTQYGSAVTFDPKGYEAGHQGMTVIIPVDAVNTMFGRGFVNTILGEQYIQPITKVIDIKFATPQANIGNLPWNPFIFVDQVRSHEIHMKNFPGTDFADQALFHSGDDNSNPGEGTYYTSKTNLCWAFEIPVDFDYPVEKADILTAYNHYAAWAQGPVGSTNPYNDWYKDLSGYRNPVNIWHP
jgi:LruC domain-containing protein